MYACSKYPKTLRKHGIPVTRQNWIDLAWPDSGSVAFRSAPYIRRFMTVALRDREQRRLMGLNGGAD